MRRTRSATNAVKGSRKLKPGALNMYVSDGHRAAVEAIGEYHLCLPSGLVLILHNCHYAPSITRGIISVSHLYKDGFINRFVNDNTISVSRNNLVYFCAIPRDVIYEIDLSSFNTNDSSMYAISNKKAKLNLDCTLLWHCRPGHISKKRIEKLQHDGLLNSIDINALFSSYFFKEREGREQTMSRQRASYFVTFTDDFSRHAYVYLLKHKHEVFETFKVFQKEVENQLGETIKSLRSDCGGEYISQEFLDHLKEHEIIAHHTPPCTPQHNGVSERRNRTLLDMVRSMMSQTTLPKSFWDYALESVTRILNMVLTKKVEKTPYEIECVYTSMLRSMSWGDLGEPANYKAALLDPQSNKWLDAINVEIQSMKDNDVWDLVDLPPNGKTIGNKWLFKKKTGMDGAVYTFKARLVARGFTQTYGVDYEETLSLVADIRAIRILIAISAFYDYEI
ncbi:retrotransposon protein, putative, ty1-copia subclass [Tanacetum coccineum]